MNAYLVSILSAMGISIILAISLNIILGFCGQISLGHAAFFGAGAYAAALTSAATGSLVASLAAATVVGCIFGILVGIASLRVRGDFLAIVTLGVNFLFVGIVRKQKWAGAEMGLSQITPSGLGATGNMILILIIALVTVFASVALNASWMGFIFRAVGEDETAAASLGIKIAIYKIIAFAIGTAVAGLAGGLYAFFTLFVSPDAFSFVLSVQVLTMVVIGGAGSTWGVLAAAVILSLLPETMRVIQDYRLLVFGALLVFAILVAPNGFAGLTRRLKASVLAGGARA